MSRRLIVSILAVCLLVACGQIIIQMPTGALTTPLRTTFPKGYELLYSDAPYAFRYSYSGEPVRRGAVSERYELRNGDCSGTDCGTTHYRAEIRELPATTKAQLNGDIWYGWSFYNDTINTVTKDQSLGTVIGQWKMDGNQSPVIRLTQAATGEGNWATCDPTICNRNLDPALDVVLDLEDMRIGANWGPVQNFGSICKLFSMALNKGKWVDLVLNTNFGTNGNGYVRVWVNGTLMCDYHGRVVASAGDLSARKGPGMRRGIFASYTQRWTDKFGSAPKPTMVVYYDEFLVGYTQQAVDTRMLDALLIPPKD